MMDNIQITTQMYSDVNIMIILSIHFEIHQNAIAQTTHVRT